MTLTPFTDLVTPISGDLAEKPWSVPYYFAVAEIK